MLGQATDISFGNRDMTVGAAIGRAVQTVIQESQFFGQEDGSIQGCVGEPTNVESRAAAG